MIISVYFKKIVVIMLAPSKRCGVSVESFLSQNELLFRILDFYRFAATESTSLSKELFAVVRIFCLDDRSWSDLYFDNKFKI